MNFDIKPTVMVRLRPVLRIGQFSNDSKMQEIRSNIRDELWKTHEGFKKESLHTSHKKDFEFPIGLNPNM